jgi:hypothetical protein
MNAISIRGLDDAAVLRIKEQAQREGISMNALMVRLLETSAGTRAARGAPMVYDELDALAGSWTAAQVSSFGRLTAAFSEVDPALWR